jgi:hypothetical protein
MLLGGDPPSQFGPGLSRAAVAASAGLELDTDLMRSFEIEGTAEPNDHLGR